MQNKNNSNFPKLGLQDNSRENAVHTLFTPSSLSHSLWLLILGSRVFHAQDSNDSSCHVVSDTRNEQANYDYEIVSRSTWCTSSSSPSSHDVRTLCVSVVDTGVRRLLCSCGDTKCHEVQINAAHRHTLTGSPEQRVRGTDICSFSV